MRKKCILYRAKLDGAHRTEGHVLRYARMGIPYRAQLDGARPCEAFEMRYAKKGYSKPRRRYSVRSACYKAMF